MSHADTEALYFSNEALRLLLTLDDHDEQALRIAEAQVYATLAQAHATLALNREARP